MTPALRSLVEDLEQDRSLYEPAQFRRRSEALDRLDAYLLIASEEPRARDLSSRLENANVALYEAIRRDIQNGAGSDLFVPWLNDAGHAHGDGYDHLDDLIIGVLQIGDPGPHIGPLGSEMVFYQPTPARHIFDLIARTALTERDVLIDFGSGLGHVPLLASICTRSLCIGVELESAYIECARQSAAGLNLRNVTFLQQDARAADLSSGTVFYLYTPFTGAILRAVLDSLRHEAASRPIRICSFGPCTRAIAEESWLEATEEWAADRIAIFRPRT